jgi:DNA-binding transcriptional ArsR family regulator
MKNIGRDDPYRIFFSAMSNGTRLAIIKAIEKKSLSVSEICSELGFKQSRVSRSLAFLTDCGFVQAQRKGKQKFYSLNQKTMRPIIGLIDIHMKKYCRHLERCGVIKK